MSENTEHADTSDGVTSHDSVLTHKLCVEMDYAMNIVTIRKLDLVAEIPTCGDVINLRRQ